MQNNRAMWNNNVRSIRTLCCIGCFKYYFIADIMQSKYILLFQKELLLIYIEQTHTHLKTIKVQDKYLHIMYLCRPKPLLKDSQASFLYKSKTTLTWNIKSTKHLKHTLRKGHANNLDPLQEPIHISHHVAPLRQKGPAIILESQGR